MLDVKPFIAGKRVTDVPPVIYTSSEALVRFEPEAE
jgi:hypothetical protein